MTLLELIQEFCDRRGLERPSIVVSSSDSTIRQLRSLANEVISDIVKRPRSWARLQKEATFVTVAAESQGALSTIAPFGFRYLIWDTLYDRTDRRPLFGPRNDADWQNNKALVMKGPFYSFRLWQGNFYMQPTPPAGHTIAFEYASDYGIRGVTSNSDPTMIWKQRYTNDSDTFQLDDDLLLAGLKWKWRKEQGLAYKQEFDDFEYLLVNTIGREPTSGTLSMAGQKGDSIRPGVIVPSGN